jgi:hypothetical protein
MIPGIIKLVLALIEAAIELSRAVSDLKQLLRERMSKAKRKFHSRRHAR